MEEVVEAQFSVGDDRGFEAETACAHFGELVRIGEQNPVIGSNVDE